MTQPEEKKEKKKHIIGGFKAFFSDFKESKSGKAAFFFARLSSRTAFITMAALLVGVSSVSLPLVGVVGVSAVALSVSSFFAAAMIFTGKGLWTGQLRNLF